jgi:hypothetical protein
MEAFHPMFDSDWTVAFDPANPFLRDPVEAAHCHRRRQVTRLATVSIG